MRALGRSGGVGGGGWARRPSAFLSSTTFHLSIYLSPFFPFYYFDESKYISIKRKNTLERIEEAQQLLGERYLREKMFQE